MECIVVIWKLFVDGKLGNEFVFKWIYRDFLFNLFYEFVWKGILICRYGCDSVIGNRLIYIVNIISWGS